MAVESQPAALQLLQRLSVPEMISRLAAHPASLARLAKQLFEGGETQSAIDIASRARQLADFSLGGPFTNHRASVELRSTGGTVNGIARWIWLGMDAEGTYENSLPRGLPRAGPSCSRLCLLS